MKLNSSLIILDYLFSKIQDGVVALPRLAEQYDGATSVLQSSFYYLNQKVSASHISMKKMKTKQDDLLEQIIKVHSLFFYIGIN